MGNKTKLSLMGMGLVLGLLLVVGTKSFASSSAELNGGALLYPGSKKASQNSDQGLRCLVVFRASDPTMFAGDWEWDDRVQRPEIQTPGSEESSYERERDRQERVPDVTTQIIPVEIEQDPSRDKPVPNYIDVWTPVKRRERPSAKPLRN